MKMKIYGALLIVFISGLSTGFLLGQHVDRTRMHFLMQRGPKQLEGLLMERLARQLNLSPVQTPAIHAKVSLVVNEVEHEFRQRGEVMRSRMTRLLADIRPLLDPEQQKILDRMDADDLRPGPPPPRRGHRPPPPDAPAPPPPL